MMSRSICGLRPAVVCVVLMASSNVGSTYARDAAAYR
jgi:hypothetical protein